jgi:membrane-bound lytic murein transglycosylase D
MMYCGMKLKFTPAARTKLQELVNQLTKNYVYYKLMSDRAATYMPFIRDGFMLQNTPTDLAYISIQESGLRGGVVSSSNAVGFWQMKDFTAREVGLRVDGTVDERKHIFRASMGAAKYFQTNYNRYSNWVYSVISYYAGGSGARPYTDQQYYGATEMMVYENTHWYAMKAIAHRIAYEPGIRAITRPQLFLVPHSTNGELSVPKLAARHGVPLEKFREHNLWIGANTLPNDRYFSYYVPQDYRQIALADPLRDLFASPPRNVVVALADTTGPSQQLAVAEASENRPVLDIRPGVMPAPPVPNNAIRYVIFKEEMFNREFTVARKGETLERIAARTHIPIAKLRRWNQLHGNAQPKPGAIVLLVKPRKATVHVAGSNETTVDVAFRYRRNPQRVLYLNRGNNVNQTLQEGQKVYLRERRPRTQPLILYSIPDSLTGIPRQVHTQPQVVQPNRPNTAPGAQPQRSQPNPTPGAQVRPVQAPVLGGNPPANLPVQPNPSQTGNPAMAPAVPSQGATVQSPEQQQPANPVQSHVEQQLSPNTAPSNTAQNTPEPPMPSAQTRFHTVRPGETLYSLSRLYQVSVPELQLLNRLGTSTTLSVGQNLRVSR